MNILFLAPYLPYPARGGGETRIYQLLRHAAARHAVQLLALTPPNAPPAALQPAIQALQQFCKVQTFPAVPHTIGRRLRTLACSTMPDMVLRGRQPRFAAALETLLQGAAFDVVQAESIEMAQYGRGQLARRQDISGRRPLFCYDAFNAEYLLQRRAFFNDLRHPRALPAAGYSLAQWAKLRRYERRLGHSFDLIFAVSAAEGQVLARLTRVPTEVVPNGVDTAFFRRADARMPREAAPGTPGAPMLLFTGTLDFRPNVDAVVWFARDVWPALRARSPDLRFCVVGQRPVPAVRALGGEPGIHIVGPVDDTRPWFTAAAVYILPMRIGGGVRLKLLETWAMQTPCVTTTLGAEGVAGFAAGEHALVADDPPAFATAVARLLDDRALAARLASAGRALVERSYDWRALVERMEQAWIKARSRD